MKKVRLYCDGSSLGNPGAGGWCAILQYQNQEKILCGNAKNVTNNQMELRAVIEGIRALKEPCEVELFSDSQYVCGGINEWLKKWVLKHFKDVKNPDLWKEFLQVSLGHQIRAFWVKGHNGHLQNERCDKIAREKASQIQTSQIKE